MPLDLTLTPFIGVIGITALLTVAFLMSNNKRAISWRVVVSGLALQVFLAVFILKVPLGQQIFHTLGQGIEKLLSFSDQGAAFVFGPLVSQPDTMAELFGPAGAFLFAFKVIPTIIFISALVSMAYHIGLLQRVVQGIAWLVYRLLGVSGAEALSNAASVFVGQVEAQLVIKPYVATMTNSELLAVMSGSLACIAGGVMAVYIQMGIPAEYLLAASLMAVPGALVVSKIVFPETEASVTREKVSLTLEKTTVNLIDAAAHGASDGLRIGLQVVGMLIAFIALVGMADFGIGQLGLWLDSFGLTLDIVGLDLTHLTLASILGTLFSGVAWALGVPLQDAATVGSLMGTKMVVNEFVAYTQLTPLMEGGLLSPKSIAIATFALCGFANFGSIAIQLGGIGEMAPTRKADLARLGLKALICGTMASYISGALAGMLVEVNGESVMPGALWPWVAMGVAALMIFLSRYLEKPNRVKAKPRPVAQPAEPAPMPVLVGESTEFTTPPKPVTTAKAASTKATTATKASAEKPSHKSRRPAAKPKK